MMKQKTVLEIRVAIALTLITLAFLAVVIPGGLAIYSLVAPDDSVLSRELPFDLCLIDGKPMTPELDYIGHGTHSGLVLKYINTDGDLVLLSEDEPIGKYEGDFCR